MFECIRKLQQKIEGKFDDQKELSQGQINHLDVVILALPYLS